MIGGRRDKRILMCSRGGPPKTEDRPSKSDGLSQEGSLLQGRWLRSAISDLFNGSTPGSIFVKRCHCTCKRSSIGAEILFIDDAVLRDDECHHAR